VLSFDDRVQRVARTLEDAGIPHAFGGAIALAYWTHEPRGTRDIDINVFVAPETCETVLEHLPDGITYDKASIETIKRDGQVRLWWEDTPVDLFFSNLPIHDDAARHRHQVPFEGRTIPVLGPFELSFFKAMPDRTRDWADIEEMLSARSFDPDRLAILVREHVGDDDPRLNRLNDAVTRANAS